MGFRRQKKPIRKKAFNVGFPDGGLVYVLDDGEIEYEFDGGSMIVPCLTDRNMTGRSKK